MRVFRWWFSRESDRHRSITSGKFRSVFGPRRSGLNWLRHVTKLIVYRAWTTLALVIPPTSVCISEQTEVYVEPCDKCARFPRFASCLCVPVVSKTSPTKIVSFNSKAFRLFKILSKEFSIDSGYCRVDYRLRLVHVVNVVIIKSVSVTPQNWGTPSPAFRSVTWFEVHVRENREGGGKKEEKKNVSRKMG